MTQNTSRSKQTYKNLYIQNKEEKLTHKFSLKSQNVNDSFISNQSDLNFMKKRDTITQEKLSQKNFNYLNIDYIKAKERNSVFVNKSRDLGSNRSVVPQGNISNRRRSILKEPESTKDIMPSIKELSYVSEAKQRSNNTLVQIHIPVFKNLVQENTNNIFIQNKSMKKSKDSDFSKSVSFRNKKNNSKMKNSSYKENNKEIDVKGKKENLNTVNLANDTNNKSLKDNLSRIYLNSKLDKKKSKNIHEYLYKSAEALRLNREIYVKESIKREFTFSPNITKLNSSKKENKDEFINRLVNSKKINNYISKLNKCSSNLESSVDLRRNFMVTQKSISRNKGVLSSRLKTTSKEGNNDYSTNMISNEDYVSNQSSRKYLNTSFYEKNLKDQYEKSNENRKSIENFFKNSFTLKSKENIKKFKLNNLKDIFEVICKNCDNIDDLHNMDCTEINDNVKQRLLLPCCEIMKERELDFNFQNFYLISNEIMNSFV